MCINEKDKSELFRRLRSLEDAEIAETATLIALTKSGKVFITVLTAVIAVLFSGIMGVSGLLLHNELQALHALQEDIETVVGGLDIVADALDVHEEYGRHADYASKFALVAGAASELRFDLRNLATGQLQLRSDVDKLVGN